MNAEIEVLVVEDEASLRRSLTKYLERAGYTFECCATAREALALAERLVPVLSLRNISFPMQMVRGCWKSWYGLSLMWR